MRQTFDEATDRSFGPRHVPLIRKAMADQGLDGFVAPHEDEHQNEYLPAANDRLAWATGFTGSAGAAVILKDKAAIFVDGRYTLQVRDQVDQAVFEIRDLVDGGVPAYLEATTTAGQVIGYATTAGFGLLTSASGTDFSLPTGPFTVMALSFVIGGLYGYVGSILVGRMVGTRSTAAA